MSERSDRRRGRGIDAIFDSTDLTLEPRRPELESLEDDSQKAAGDRGDRLLSRPAPASRPRAGRKGPGRPRGGLSQNRELVQRGFYIGPDQDRFLDETKAALKGRGFTPDRSAIVRAALDYFGSLDAFDQEDLVRRSK